MPVLLEDDLCFEDGPDSMDRVPRRVSPIAYPAARPSARVAKIVGRIDGRPEWTSG